jgi:hypothetical protein
MNPLKKKKERKKENKRKSVCFVFHTSSLALQTVSSAWFCFTTANLVVTWHDVLQTNFFLDRSKAKSPAWLIPSRQITETGNYKIQTQWGRLERKQLFLETRSL